MLRNLSEFFEDSLIFGPLEMLVCAAAVHPAIFADLDPLTRPLRVYRRPEHRAAVWAFVVFLVLRLEEKLIGID